MKTRFRLLSYALLSIVLATLQSGVALSVNTGDANCGATTTPAVYSMAIDPTNPSVLYIGARERGLFKSVNEGQSWTPVGSVLAGYSKTVHALAVNPQSPSILYAGTDPDGVYRSEDGGLTWTAKNTGLSRMIDLEVWDLAIDPITPTTVYAATSGGVYKSVNSGDSWDSSLIYSSYRLAINPAAPGHLFAAVGVSGLYSTTTGGATWGSVSDVELLDIKSIAFDPVQPATIYVAAYGNGVYKSTDTGAHWSPMSVGLTNVSVGLVAVNPITPTIVFAGTEGGGLFRSTNGGGEWSHVDDNWPLMGLYNMVCDPVNPARVYAGGPGAYQSTDVGLHWQILNVIPCKCYLPLTNK